MTATADGRTHVVRVLPFSPTLSGRADTRVLLLIRDPAARMAPDSLILRDLYGLSAAEALLARTMVEGATGLADVAKRLGISLNTAKTQLKAVFDKVGVRRQAELVARLIADAGSVDE